MTNYLQYSKFESCNHNMLNILELTVIVGTAINVLRYDLFTPRRIALDVNGTLK